MYKQRLEKLNETKDSIISDFIKEYGLEKDELYRVETIYGEEFYGYFKGMEAFSYRWRNEINIWVSFFKQKKDYTPSKRTDGFLIGRIKNIYKIPF